MVSGTPEIAFGGLKGGRGGGVTPSHDDSPSQPHLLRIYSLGLHSTVRYIELECSSFYRKRHVTLYQFYALHTVCAPQKGRRLECRPWSVFCPGEEGEGMIFTVMAAARSIPYRLILLRSFELLYVSLYVCIVGMYHWYSTMHRHLNQAWRARRVL